MVHEFSSNSYPAELEVAGTFRSALSGDATVLRARSTYPESETTRPVYFHGGYGVDSTDYLQYIAEHYGRNAFSVVYSDARSRDAGYWVGAPGAEREKGLLIPTARLRRAVSQFSGSIIADSQIRLATDVLRAMDTMGVEQTDAIGQSAGALRVMLAANRAPERVPNIVLPYPAGIIKPDPRRIASSGLRYARAWRTHAKIISENTLGSSLSARMSAPARQRSPRNTLADGENILLSHQSLILHKMRQQEKAPGVAIVAGENDYIFSPERIVDSLRATDDIDYMYVAPGLHAIGRRKQIMDRVMGLLSDVDALKTADPSEQKATSFFERLILDPGISARRSREIQKCALSRG